MRSDATAAKPLSQTFRGLVLKGPGDLTGAGLVASLALYWDGTARCVYKALRATRYSPELVIGTLRQYLEPRRTDVPFARHDVVRRARQQYPAPSVPVMAALGAAKVGVAHNPRLPVAVVTVHQHPGGACTVVLWHTHTVEADRLLPVVLQLAAAQYGVPG